MNLRLIITRTIFVIVLIVAGLYALSYFKKKGRQDDIVEELKSLSSESSFFGQFTGVEARRTMVRAVGLIAEANNLGLAPEETIERGLGLEKATFEMDSKDDKATERQKLIRKTLRLNYENFRKLGYKADFQTLESMRMGELPTIQDGARAGKKAVVGVVIDERLSPGMDCVLANLEIRPAEEVRGVTTDVEIAAARALVVDLATANVIDRVAEQRILKDLEARANRAK